MVKAKSEEWMNRLDCLPAEERRYTEIEQTVDGIARFYGFEKILLSPVEAVHVFSALVRAGLLEERPPLLCRTPAGEEFFLSPSAALGALRAYFSHHMQEFPHPVKLFFRSRVFWRDRALSPEMSKFRSPTGSGIETPDEGPFAAGEEWGLVIIGEEGPVAEAEIIQVLYKTAAELGINNGQLELRLNSSACRHCQPSYRSALVGYLRRHAVRLCSKSKRDLKRSPYAILSCAEERCRQIAASAPQVLDFLCERCKKQLRSLLEFLDEARIPYFLDARLFREGSWLSEIVFDLLLGSNNTPPVEDSADSKQNSENRAGEADGKPERRVSEANLVLARGGRMVEAAEILGGKEVYAASGVLFLDAAVAAIRRRELEERTGGAEVFFVQLGELAKRKSFEILEVLREGDIAVKESLGRDSIKIQLKIAERLASRLALILGQKEALDGTIIVREVESGIQETIPQEKLVEFLKRKLKK